MKYNLICLVVLLLIVQIAVGQEQKVLPRAQGRGNIQNARFNGRSITLPGSAAAQDPGTFLTAERIKKAIDSAADFLRSCQQPDGQISCGNAYGGGSTALAALALLASGAHPNGDTALMKALEWLQKLEVDNTYVRAIRANVWEYALRRMPGNENFKQALKKDFEWLQKALGEKEGWRYNLKSRDWDNSCTQYGVLGIWAAVRAGFDPGDAFWKKMSDHFLSCQNADGGWGYQKRGSNPNMTTAGLATMFLIYDMYHGRNCYGAENPQKFASEDAKKCVESIERGMEWLGKTAASKDDGYYLYGIERTGVASGRKYIGGEDWFERGAITVLSRQASNGSIRLGRWGGPAVGTSFCMLFLVYGGAPVAFNKLQYGSDQDWNLNPRDLANLTKNLWSAYEKPLNWHSVSITDNVEEFEAPILFISGSRAAKFSEEEVQKLRKYVRGGGIIFAEPSDRSEEFEKSMQELVRRMFPEDMYPSYKLEPLAENHGLYTALRQKWDKRPRIMGVSNGSRTFFFVSKEYMSADWQANKTDSDSFKLGMNLLFYAADLGTLAPKYTSHLPDTSPASFSGSSIAVARVKHAGAEGYPSDWEAGVSCWENFAPYFGHVSGYAILEKPPITLGKGKLIGIDVLHITGRKALVLSDGERDMLRKYVEIGGTVLVDAYAGSRDFASSARKEIETIFGKLEPLAEDSALVRADFKGGNGELDKDIRFKLPARKMLRERGMATSGQKLEVITVGKRAAVVFSEFDLTGAIAGIRDFRAIGYTGESARNILANILAHAAAE
ncbi:MAG: DUF4159 domain-containing protein [Planctomycetota bacterium]|jgi:hypothetical protein